MISIETACMRKAIEHVGPSVGRKSSAMAFRHIRIRAQGSLIEFVGASGETQATYRGECQSKDDSAFDLCVPADRIAPILDIADLTITITPQDNGRVKFSTGKSRIALPSIPGWDFPIMRVEGDTVVDIDVAGLGDLLKAVSFAADPRDIREFCQGVWLESDGTELTATATDGHVMATAQVALAAPSFCTLLSVHAATLVASLDPEQITVTNSHITARRGNAEIVVVPMASRPINWRRMVPEPKSAITFDSASLREAVSLHKFYGDKLGAVRFSIKDGQYEIDIDDKENAANVSIDELESAGDHGFEFAFKGELLAQLLMRSPADKTTFYWDPQAKTRAVLVQNGNWRGVLSPLTY